MTADRFYDCTSNALSCVVDFQNANKLPELVADTRYENYLCLSKCTSFLHWSKHWNAEIIAHGLFYSIRINRTHVTGVILIIVIIKIVVCSGPSSQTLGLVWSCLCAWQKCLRFHIWDWRYRSTGRFYNFGKKVMAAVCQAALFEFTQVMRNVKDGKYDMNMSSAFAIVHTAIPYDSRRYEKCM